MVESEEVSLQAMTETREGFCCSKYNREIIPLFGGQEGDKCIFDLGFLVSVLWASLY